MKKLHCFMVKYIFTKEKKTEIDMFDYARYRSLTKKADWRGICELNGVHFDSFSPKNMLES